MRVIFSRLFFLLLFIVGFGLIYSLYFSLGVGHQTASVSDSVFVKKDNIVQTVSASGKIEAKKITRLGFPVTGIIQNIYKEEGESAVEGEVIASLTSNVLIAEYNAALEQVRFYQQGKKELIRGPIAEERKVARANVLLAKAELQKVIQEYEQAISNAKKNLLSSSLTAYPIVKDNNDIPPVISGSYQCEEEGELHLDIFATRAQSGYSYKLSGMATGTFEANSIIPAPLGDCGLYIKFDEDEYYRNSSWVISIPNKRGSNYTALKNAYDMLVVEYQASKKLAEEAVQLAEDDETRIIAPASEEELTQADSSLDEAVARLLVYEARIADYTIRSPFSGVVSAVDMKIGESASPNHTVTIINEGEYNLIARVPEIDITKISVGDDTLVAFDAETKKEFTGRVSFVSPVSVSVGGVSYYEVHIVLDETPTWLREGLNSDVKIIVDKKENILTIPDRFVITEDNNKWVLIQNKGKKERVPVEIGLSGGGMIEVLNLPVDTEVYLP